MRAIMELYQLKTFLTVARMGNLTRAAEFLGASQPAVSAQIKALEEELGVILFNRTPRGMELTEAGRLISESAEEVSLKAEELAARARILSGRPAASFRIGLNTEAGLLRVPELLEELSKDPSAPRLELVQGVTKSIIEDVLAGRMGAGFVFGSPAGNGLDAVTLCRIELVIAAPASWGHRLEGAPLSRILAEAWVRPPEECPFHDNTRALFREAGMVPPAGVVADDESTILRLVRSCVGLSLLPSFMLKDEGTRGEVICLRAGASEIALSFLYRSREADSPILLSMLRAIKRVWGTR
jgi:DNA-binding transcriptional LysR family regulator